MIAIRPVGGQKRYLLLSLEYEQFFLAPNEGLTPDLDAAYRYTSEQILRAVWDGESPVSLVVFEVAAAYDRFQPPEPRFIVKTRMGNYWTLKAISDLEHEAFAFTMPELRASFPNWDYVKDNLELIPVEFG